jgi:hypothetical protein
MVVSLDSRLEKKKEEEKKGGRQGGLGELLVGGMWRDPARHDLPAPAFRLESNRPFELP